jgi:hypothetical protein
VNERPDEEPYWHLLANELVKQWAKPDRCEDPSCEMANGPWHIHATIQAGYSRIPRWAYEWQHPERFKP